MTVITISRQYGSGGDEIAEQVCHIAGLSVLDKRILMRAASEAGVSDQEIVDYSESNFKVRSLFSRLFNRTQPVAELRIWKEDMQGVRKAETVPLSEEHAMLLVRQSVETAYKLGNMVIVGRGGQVLLRGRSGALHVRIVAELEDRILRVRSDPSFDQSVVGNSVEARHRAQALIDQRDQASAAYLRQYFAVDWADPLLYHVIINTSLLKIDLAAQLILEMARHGEASLA